MKRLLVALVFLLSACGGNDFQLVEICPDFNSNALDADFAYVMGCPDDSTPLFDDLEYYEVIPWGITRVGAPLIRTNRTVWILDTGIDLDNPELNVDIERSISFVDLSEQRHPNDEHGHGTHVAGTVAAKQNGFGVVGVAPGNTVVAVKVLSKYGWGSWEWVASGIDYIAENAEPGDVVNVSLGGWKSDASKFVEDAVLNAADKGIFFSIAAGNSRANAENFSPASVEHENVLTVSAINKDDCRASFSNFGKTIEYAAPGVEVLSTFKDGQYKIWQGTSMATPHITGLLLYGQPRNDGWVGCGLNKKPEGDLNEPIAHY